MVSSHSQKVLRKRAQEFWINKNLWQGDLLSEPDYEKLHRFLLHEYQTIPEKERIGKGQFFIAKVTAQGIASLITQRSEENLFTSLLALFEYAENQKKLFLHYFCLVLAGEVSSFSKDLFQRIMNQTLFWADHPEWEIRETVGYIIRKGLKVQSDQILSLLQTWSTSSSENIRRIVSESLRPLADIKWLRDPSKNDQILHLLSQLKCDPSIYVRTSVGNNLKDLTKYMPEKILLIASNWIKEYNIDVVHNLASLPKKILGDDQYYLIWTLKHTFRWIQKRNPEYHPQLRLILGSNYVDYFDEKRNRLAKPKK